MRLIRYRYAGAVAWGVEDGETVRALEGDLFGAFSAGAEVAPVAEVERLAPWGGGKIIGVALNYPGIEDAPHDESYEPLFFLKAANTLVPHGADIRYREGLFEEAWMEVELAFMVGRRAAAVGREAAMAHILGYTIANDVTATNVHGRDHHLARSKSMDTFCPMGPALETDFDPRDVPLRSWVNGELVQDGRTGQRFFDDAACLAAISRSLTLEPGDMILTGTPIGTGPASAGRVRPGDAIAMGIPGLGRLESRVVAS